jgi:hypothetical protein
MSEADTEVADPYVVAMAWEIQEASSNRRVIVVTDDRIDRMPAKESVVTACERLGISYCPTSAFVKWVRSEAIEDLTA